MKPNNLSFLELNNDNFEKYIDALISSSRESRENSGSDTKEWFRSKFLCSPLGDSLNVIAYDSVLNRVAGFVSYGRYDFVSNDDRLKLSIPYDIFVNPKYRGKSLFKKLLFYCEKRLKELGNDILFIFPNTNSYRGTISSGFVDFDYRLSYLIKPVSLKFFLNILDLKKRFRSFDNNSMQVNENINFENSSDQYLSSWNDEYFSWRFNLIPQSTYDLFSINGSHVLIRYGCRGCLKEAQILKIFGVNEYGKLIKPLKQELKMRNVDFISFPTSSNAPYISTLKKKLFFKVPNSTNIVYKKLSSKNIDLSKFIIQAGDFHTY